MLLAALSGLAAAATGDAAATARQPNLIFVMADGKTRLCLLVAAVCLCVSSVRHAGIVRPPDLGMNDVGYSDKTVVSPTIDAFAAGGIKLTNICVYLPLLCPSAQLSGNSDLPLDLPLVLFHRRLQVVRSFARDFHDGPLRSDARL
jgi:hypothetical protein|eukprot:COSAG06_NODE_1_length_58652_cov_31.600967_14_plen_146_part_00